MARFFGTPSEVHVGQQFIDRTDLHNAAVHAPTQAGISGTAKDGADSIVLSGGYVDDKDYGDYIIYTGHGGNVNRKQVADQSIEDSGNAALLTSMVRALPVRVTRGSRMPSPFAPTAGYRYAGLFMVKSFVEKIGKDGFKIVQFRLERIAEQDTYVTAALIEPDPEYATTLVTRRIRDSAVTRSIKSLYDYACQACGTSVIGFEGRRYAEGAHVRPLGKPHLGSDSTDNVVCLCPNHHTQLDTGGLFIKSDMSLEDGAGVQVGELQFRKQHSLLSANATYHWTYWKTAS